MTPYYSDESTTIHHGDALEVMDQHPAGSVDLIVTDPPYIIGAVWRGIERIACDGLRRDGDIYCRRHRKAADASNARRRKPREETS